MADHYQLLVGVENCFQHLAHEGGIVHDEHAKLFGKGADHGSTIQPARSDVPPPFRSVAPRRPAADLLAPASSETPTRLPSPRGHDASRPRARTPPAPEFASSTDAAATAPSIRTPSSAASPGRLSPCGIHVAPPVPPLPVRPPQVSRGNRSSPAFFPQISSR